MVSLRFLKITPIVIACAFEATGCDQPSDNVSPDAIAPDGEVSAAHRTYFKSANSRAGNSFGAAIAMSADGDTLAVSAHEEPSIARGVNSAIDGDAAPRSGAVFIYTRVGEGWVQKARIKASNTEANDLFGSSLALSADGKHLAVGAVGEDGGSRGINGSQSDNSALESGAVYLFAVNDGEWSQTSYIKASNSDAHDSFGESVALSDDGRFLAVGASLEDGDSLAEWDNSQPDSGAVYVFEVTGDVLFQREYIKPDRPMKNGLFGWSLALSGDASTLVVGAIGMGPELLAGEAFIFERTYGTWSQGVSLSPSVSGRGDTFGWDVSISGNGTLVAVGANGESSSSRGLNGDAADNSAPISGAAYLFARVEGCWAQNAYLKASNADAYDVFGISVSLSLDGSALAIGAPGESSSARNVDGNQDSNGYVGAGAAYLFLQDGSGFSQMSYVKASNTDPGDSFGTDVAVSMSGRDLIVGAPGEESSSQRIDGDSMDNSAPGSGAVYLLAPMIGSSHLMQTR